MLECILGRNALLPYGLYLDTFRSDSKTLVS